jgi:uncharacterized membrane-anchored protein
MYCRNVFRRAPLRPLFISALLLTSLGLLTARAAYVDDRTVASWQKGPSTGKLKQTATVEFPDGYRFADAHSTMRVLEKSGEKPTGREMGMLMPMDGTDWALIFLFDEIGYVKESGAGSWDTAELLKTLNRANEAANEERKKARKPVVPRITWEQKPTYSSSKHMLEWATRGETADGQTNIQHTLLLLGRKGAMEFKVACDADKLATVLPLVRDLATGFNYRPGEKYEEHAFSDKLARGDLEGLITGESVAKGSKLGIWATILLIIKTTFKILIKILIWGVVIGGLAAAYFFIRIYKKKPKGLSAS